MLLFVINIRQYVKIIQKGMAKAELLLKLIGSTPQSMLVESYKTNIPDGSESDFQKILELKVFPLKLVS